jgi:hypothetical protein
MIILYTFVLLFLGAIKWLIDRKAGRLERKFARIAKAADELLRQPQLRGGTTKQPDPAQIAKRQYLIGQLVQKRDRLEAKYDAWQGAAEKFRRVIARVRNWKGRLLPYSLGVLDVIGVLVLADYPGGPSGAVTNLVDQVSALLTP